MIACFLTESFNVDIDDSVNMKIRISLIRFFLDCISVNSIPPSDSYDITNLSQCKPECNRIALNYTSLNNPLTVHEKGLYPSFFLD